MAARLLVTAWKPLLIDWTDLLDPQDSHWRKKRRVSFWRMVSGERHVAQATYSSVQDKDLALKLRTLFDQFMGWKTYWYIGEAHFQSASVEIYPLWSMYCWRRPIRWYPTQRAGTVERASADDGVCKQQSIRIINQSRHLVNDLRFADFKEVSKGGLLGPDT